MAVVSGFFDFTSASSAFSAPVPALSIFRSCTLGIPAKAAVAVTFCIVFVCVRRGAGDVFFLESMFTD